MIPGATCSSFPELLGECPALRTVHAQIGRALDVPLPVLIEGETGTGKDLAAWLIHGAFELPIRLVKLVFSIMITKT